MARSLKNVWKVHWKFSSLTHFFSDPIEIYHLPQIKFVLLLSFERLPVHTYRLVNFMFGGEHLF